MRDSSNRLVNAGVLRREASMTALFRPTLRTLEVEALE